MDGAAAALTLISAAVLLAKQAIEVLRAIEDSPTELKSLSETVATVPVILRQLNSFDDDFLRDRELCAALRSALSNTETVLQRVKNACYDSGEDFRLRRRLRWALLEKKEVTKLISQLQTAQIGVFIALKPFQL